MSTATTTGADTLTVLRARDDRRLAKLIHVDGRIEDYNSSFFYDAAELPVRDLAHLKHYLIQMLARPDCCVVRGQLIDGPRARRIRRLLHPDAKTGDQPTLQVASRRWLAIDMDSIAKPEDIDSADIQSCADHAIAQLPDAFHNVHAIATATAGHGIKSGIRMRLWFWLSRPTRGVELKRWLADSAIDKSVFSNAQPIYTSAPVFSPGRVDHLPKRLVELAGEAEVTVPSPKALEPPTRAAQVNMPKVSTDTDRYVRGALASAVASILRQDIGGRHPTLIAEGCLIARYVHANRLSERDMRDALGRAAERVGKDADEVDECLTWSLANPNKTPLPDGANGR